MKVTKELLDKLEAYQETLSDDYDFEKYEDCYSSESCHGETLSLVDGEYLFTWTHSDYDGDSYGLWFKVKKDLLDAVEITTIDPYEIKSDIYYTFNIV